MRATLTLRHWRRAHRYAQLREDHEIDRWLAAIRKETPMPDTPDPWNLARTQRGRMIHHADCHWARNATPWQWAADKSLHDLRVTTLRLGMRTCLHCRPLSRP